MMGFSYKVATVNNEEKKMDTHVEHSTTSGSAGLLAVWLVLLAVAGAVATMLWMLRS